MNFDGKEWVREIAVTTLAGIVGGWVTITIAPDAPDGTMLIAGSLGLTSGLLNQPLRWGYGLLIRAMTGSDDPGKE